MRRAFVVVVLLCVGSVTAGARGGGQAPAGRPKEFHSRDPAYAEADAALNEARLAAGSPAEAKERIARLRKVLRKHPDYPYRAWARYYLGINYQLLGRYDQAAEAFGRALRDSSALKGATPIAAYLAQARQERFVSYSSVGLIAAIVLVLAASIWALIRRGGAVRWRRLLVVFGLAAAVWLAAVLLLPVLLGKPTVGLEVYPKPVLATSQLGQLGDRLLWLLLAYGVGAIFAAMVVMAAVSGLRRRAKTALGVAGTLVVTFALMGLFSVRYCYHRCRYEPRNARLFFMYKDIATKKEVPDEMLPLYDPDFRARILKQRGQK